jgi:hypothetical protein
MHARGAVAALILGSLRVAPVASAQEPVRPSPRGAACLDSIPEAAMRRVPVYAAAEIAEETPVGPSVIASMDLLTQAVAERARALLGASAAQLPPGEPTITWRQLDQQLRVVAHRDGRVGWTVQPPWWRSDQGQGDAGVRHLGAALDEARRQGELFVWDDALARDSIMWHVRLEPAALSEAGLVTPPALRRGFPVFSVLSPPILAADVERMRTNFPMVRVRGFSGTVQLQFVIDTAGRAVPSSIRGVWPPNEPRLTGPPAFAYDSLLRVMRGSLVAARFTPARIGRCAINQLMFQSFSYQPAR